MVSRNMLKKILLVLLILIVCAIIPPAWIILQDVLVSRQTVDDIRPADKAIVLATKAFEYGKLNPCLVARGEAAAELYNAGKVKKLIVSGGISRDLQYSSHHLQLIAERKGVPPAHIELEEKAGSTYENMVFSDKFLQDSPRIVLVSAGFHLMRARGLAEKQWPDKDRHVAAAPFCSEPRGGYLYTIMSKKKKKKKNGDGGTH